MRKSRLRDGPNELRATIVVMDGARPDVFSSLADAGDLPHLSCVLSTSETDGPDRKQRPQGFHTTRCLHFELQGIGQLRNPAYGDNVANRCNPSGDRVKTGTCRTLPGKARYFSTKDLSFFERDGCRSFPRALASICRMRSRVT